jgi:hypothetical protein
MEGRRLALALGKVVVAALVMACSAWGINAALLTVAPGPAVLLRAGRLAAAIGGGLVVLVASATLLRIEEFQEALGALRARVPDVVRSGRS